MIFRNQGQLFERMTVPENKGHLAILALTDFTHNSKSGRRQGCGFGASSVGTMHKSIFERQEKVWLEVKMLFLAKEADNGTWERRCPPPSLLASRMIKPIK